MKSILISIIGAPHSGKSTLATDLHTTLKINHDNSIFISEEASNFIAEYGVPSSPMDQMIIFYKQLNRERMFIGSKDYIVCDSSSLLNYFYFRSLFDNPLSNKDIASINHIQKEILKSINQWSYIFYVPPIKQKNVVDGIRFHNEVEISQIDNNIKCYLAIENIKYYDLSDIDMLNRKEYILSIIKNRK